MQSISFIINKIWIFNSLAETTHEQIYLFLYTSGARNTNKMMEDVLNTNLCIIKYIHVIEMFVGISVGR